MLLNVPVSYSITEGIPQHGMREQPRFARIAHIYTN
jgi:hypothetical protein